MSIQPKESPEIRATINQVSEDDRKNFFSTGWWHSIDLGDGRITPGVRSIDDLRERYASFNLPDDLSGKRVLDIGCWDGFYSFEAEKHGAEVVAVDCWRSEKFFEAHRALSSKVVFHEMSVYEISRERLGAFDIVLFLGVLYHLQHPLLALQRVCEVTSDVAVIESHTIDNILNTTSPIMEFYEMDELGGQYDNWWAPNSECLIKMIRAAGFVRTEIARSEMSSAAVKAYRRLIDLKTQLSPSIRILDVTNACTFERHYPRRGRQAYLAIWAEGLPDEATRENVVAVVGDYESLPYYVGPVHNLQGGGKTNPNKRASPSRLGCR
jgi:tRNA (mo5U34)-methyltransferase